MTDSAGGLAIDDLEIGGNTCQLSDDFPCEIECVTGDVEIALRGKNLIKFAKEDWIGGYFNVDGSLNGWGGTKEGLIDSRYYRVPNGFDNIVLSFMPLKDLRIAQVNLAFYDKDKIPISSMGSIRNVLGSKGIKSIKIVSNLNVPDNARYFRFNIKWVVDSNDNKINMYDEFYNYIDELQLEVGREATEYVKCEGDNYTLSLGDKELLEGEYLCKRNDKWYKHKVYEKIASYANEEVTTDYISTTGELSEGATVYYKLENEVDEEITAETLITQLESLNKAKTYKKITHIDSVSDELRPILKIKYKQDLETVRENDKKELQDKINNLREAIVALGGV